MYEPPPGTPLRNTRGDRRRVAIHDAREVRVVAFDHNVRCAPEGGATRKEVNGLDTTATHHGAHEKK